MTPEQLITELEKLQTQLIKRIEKGLLSGFDDVELAQVVAEFDFFEELKSLGYTDLLEQYFADYENIVLKLKKLAEQKGVSNIAGIALRDLDALIDVKAEELLGKARQYGLQLKSVLLENIVAGTPIKDLTSRLNETQLLDYQLRVAIDTGVSEFERTATAKIFENSPEQRFTLAGVDDARNRPACDVVLKYQPKEGWTKKEIDEGAATELVKEHASEFAQNKSSLEQALKNPYTFQRCGGYNCRHRWKPL